MTVSRGERLCFAHPPPAADLVHIHRGRNSFFLFPLCSTPALRGSSSPIFKTCSFSIQNPSHSVLPLLPRKQCSDCSN